MKIARLVILGALLGFSYTANADHWDRKQHREHYQSRTHEYWEGNCKVKRQYKKNGRYKESRDCGPSRRDHHVSRRSHDQRYSFSLPNIIIEPIIRIGG